MYHTNKIPFFLILLVAILPFSLVSAQDSSEPDENLLLSLAPYTDSMIVSSPITERDYLIFVNLPRSYNRLTNQAYPVLYLFDPHASFGTITGQTWLLPIIDELPELIVVGVGSPAMQGLGSNEDTSALNEVDENRLRDLLPSREADSFLEFLTGTLIPYIDANYRTNPNDRAIMGHSAGAEFVLYALFNTHGTFHRFVASSPGSGPAYAREVCVECELETVADLSGVIFLSSGESDGITNGTPAYVEQAFSTLEAYSAERLNLTVSMHIFEDTSHLSVIPFALIRGLHTVYCGVDYKPYSCERVSVQPLVRIDDADFVIGTTITTPDSPFTLRSDPRYLISTGSCRNSEATVLQSVEDVQGDIWVELACDEITGWVQKSRFED